MDKFVIVEQQGAVGLIHLNRPEVSNALNAAMIVALAEAVDRFEADPSIGALVITGGEKAFAAGADIAEMAALGGYEETFLDDFWSCPGSVDSLSSSFLDLVSINLIPTARSAAGGAAEAPGGFFLQSAENRPRIKLQAPRSRSIPGLGIPGNSVLRGLSIRDHAASLAA
jgi:enoyl-CoA hydratase